MTQDLVIGTYVTAIVVSVIIYVFMVRRICKSDNISLREAFGFRKSTTHEVKHRVYSSPIRQQISQLEQEMYNTDDGDKRRKLLEQIRKLEQQS